MLKNINFFLIKTSNICVATQRVLFGIRVNFYIFNFYFLFMRKIGQLLLSTAALLMLIPIVFVDSTRVWAANDYPYPNASMTSVDPWNFYFRNCTSFVAWRINKDKGTTSAPYFFKNTMTGPNGQTATFGDANNWDNAATAIGFTVSSTPVVGSIAVWEAYQSMGGFYVAGNKGHVAYVESINSNGTFVASNYNNGGNGAYWINSVATANKFIIFNTKKYVTGDVDGDGKRDFTIFRSWSNPTWLSRMIPQLSSTNNAYNQSYSLPTNQMGNGAATDIPLPGDFDGDKKMDPGMYTPATQGGTATWRIPLTSGAPEQVTYLGAYGDKPIVGDFDGDGKADPTIYRPSTGMWQTYFSSGIPAYTIFHGGWGEDIPLTGDFNNDGKFDYALFRPSAGAWYIYFSPATNSGPAGSLFTKMVGTVGDIPLSGDHDGDGKHDPSVYRPSTGEWLVLQSASNYAVKVMYHGGWTGDVPIYGDFDGDGRADPAIFRAISNMWYVNLTTGAPQIQLEHGGTYDIAI